MTGFLDRLTAHLHGEAPTVAVRPRGPFEPEAGPGPGPWPATGVIGQYDDTDQEPGRHAASVPPSGSVTGLADTGPADRGPDGSPAANADDPGPDGSYSGNADGPAPASPPPDARSRTAGPAGRRPPDGPARPPDGPARPADGPAQPAAMPNRLLPPDEGPAWPWSGPALPADSRSRQAPVPARGAAAASTPLASDGAAGVDRRSEDETRAPASGAAGPGGAARAAPTVILKNSLGSMTPAAEPGEPPVAADAGERAGRGTAQPAPPSPPSLDELLARHVVPALRAAGAVRSGRDTVRLTQEPVTERRGGDVHVHLGRIEVVQPPPAAAPGRAARSRPRPPAPDHEAYLARRRQDRR